MLINHQWGFAAFICGQFPRILDMGSKIANNNASRDNVWYRINSSGHSENNQAPWDWRDGSVQRGKYLDFISSFQITAAYPRDPSINLLWPSDAMWPWRSWPTLGQVMACCLTAPSHYLNQCWLTINEVLWHSIPWFLKIPRLIYKLCMKFTHAKSQPHFRVNVLALVMLNSLQEKNMLEFCIIFNTEMAQVDETIPHKDPFILYSQYHGGRWLGDTRSHSISSHAINLVTPGYSAILCQPQFLTEPYLWWLEEVFVAPTFILSICVSGSTDLLQQGSLLLLGTQLEVRLSLTNKIR